MSQLQSDLGALGANTMGTSLETLPRECLEEVLLNLDAKDMVSMMATSRALRLVAGGERMWADLAYRDFGVCEAAGDETASSCTPEGDALEGSRWRALHADIQTQLNRPHCVIDDPSDETPYDSRCPPNVPAASEVPALRSKGLFCDGGVDESDPENWFGNVFDNEGCTHRFYCSAATNNIHLVGCITEGDIHGAYKWAAASRARRRFMAKTCSLLAHVLEKLSAQSSLPAAEQLNFDTVVEAAKQLPPYDFNAWPSEELGAFFTHYVHQYRRDDPISKLFIDPATGDVVTLGAEFSMNTGMLNIADAGMKLLSKFQKIAQLVERDNELESDLAEPEEPKTHCEPLNEAEHNLYTYMFKTSPRRSLGVREAMMGKRPTNRLAATQWKEPLDLFSQNTAVRNFTHLYARFNIAGLIEAESVRDDTLGIADGSEQVSRSAWRNDVEDDGRVKVNDKNKKTQETFNHESFVLHAGCTQFFVHDPEDRRDVLYKQVDYGDEYYENDYDHWMAGSCVDSDVDKKPPRISKFMRNFKRWRHVGGIVNAFEIDRTGAFTCPVSSGAVFVSPGPPPVMDKDTREKLRHAAPGNAPEMSWNPQAAGVGDWTRNAVSSRNASTSVFDDIDTVEKLQAAAVEGTVPKITQIKETPNGVVAEFEPPAKRKHGLDTKHAFTPVCWFKFHTRDSLEPAVKSDPQRDVLRYALQKPRWSRMHCLKLIAPENLMREWEDDHPAPNVDIRRFTLFGAEIALSDFSIGDREYVSKADSGRFTKTPGVEYGDDDSDEFFSDEEYDESGEDDADEDEEEET